MSALFLMPSTQAESGVLAKIRPNGQKSVNITAEKGLCLNLDTYRVCSTP